MPQKFRWSKDGGATWTVENQNLPFNLAGVTASDAVIVEPIGTGVSVAANIAPGFAPLASQNGDGLRDQSGNRLIGSDARIDTGQSARQIAAARGIRFGTQFVVSDYQANAAYAALIRAYSDHYVTSMSPQSVQPNDGVFTFASADAFADIAAADGKSWRFHTLMYPSKDASWVTTATVTPANWRARIDAHFEAIAARPWGQVPFSFDVVNEVMNGFTAKSGLRTIQNNGSVTIPWVPAAEGNPYTRPGYPAMAEPGATYILYAFVKARQLWPTTPLYFCHDQTEMVNPISPGYTRQENANILAILSALLAAGAPIDGVNIQGHLTLSRTFYPAEFKAFLAGIKALGLKIMVGEHDVRAGNENGVAAANCSTFEYDRQIADLSKRFLDVILPFLDGGEFLTWGVSDLIHAWDAGERPLPYDASFAAKPMLTSIRNALLEL